MNRNELLQALDGKLEPWRFKDYAPNGLQVEGSDQIRRIVTGVTASQALIDEAIRLQADTILVHHGYFWKNEAAPITGIKRKRIASLLQSNINLIAYHLPLDAHPALGNNAQLGQVLGFTDAAPSQSEPLLWRGQLARPMAGEALRQHISQCLGREALLLGEEGRPLQRVAWCTGGAQGFFEQAIALGVDVFITGEVSEQNQHLANESGVSFIAAGHHATERYGAKALGQWLADEFALDVQFIDLFNPV